MIVKRVLRTRLVGFSLVGGFVFVLGIVMLTGLVEVFRLDKYLSGIITTAFSLQVNFLLNKYVNWGDRGGNFLSQWLKFHGTRLGVAAINQIIYSVLVFGGLHYLFVTVLCTAAGMVVNYIGNEKVVFKTQPQEEILCGTFPEGLELTKNN